jgi:hypothetical protein
MVACAPPEAQVLERTHQFLSEKRRAEVETAAERFFPALGYRRRDEVGSETIVFARGGRFASFYSASLRACRATVEVEASEGERTAVRVRHRVETRGRLVLAGDERLVEAEARAFERFLERGDPDTAALLEAASRKGMRAAIVKLAVAFGLLAIALIAGALLMSRRR